MPKPPPDKRLYTVTLTYQAVVWAEGYAQAERIAHEQRAHIVTTQGGVCRVQTEPLRTMPDGWDLRCLPYGDDGRTIGAILSEVKP